ncbi:MAG: HD domain-containing protein, partial [Candidatus Acidiferrales bacterium]
MRFATRAFLWSFAPIAILLALSFWVIQRRVQDTVRDSLRSSLSQTQESMSHLRQHAELENSRILRIVAENPPLKAGVQLLLANANSDAARLTVEDQLREIANTLHFDFMVISDPDGKLLAGVVRVDDQLGPVRMLRMNPPKRGLFIWGGGTFQVNSFPINVDQENIGILSIGEHFEISDFGTPAILSRKGTVLQATLAGISPLELELALQKCRASSECEIRLGRETYLTLASSNVEFSDGYTLRFLQSVDSFSGPVQTVLQRVFLIAGSGALLAAALLSGFSSRSIVRPIAAVVSRLREGEATGMLPAFEEAPASIQEIRELTDSFNRAASAVHESRENLQQAYVEFVGSLASSLDARDDYTAGHSHRVSGYSCIIGQAMRIPAGELEVLRIGALLHDIGKIGVPDHVLNKPGRLNPEEFAL